MVATWRQTVLYPPRTAALLGAGWVVGRVAEASYTSTGRLSAATSWRRGGRWRKECREVSALWSNHTD